MPTPRGVRSSAGNSAAGVTQTPRIVIRTAQLQGSSPKANRTSVLQSRFSSPRPSKSGSISSAHAPSWLVAKPMLHVGNDRGRLAFQLMELVDLLSHARGEFRFGSQILLQSFADFSTDCSAVGVINVDGVAHDGPRCPDEPRPMDHPRAFKPCVHPCPYGEFRRSSPLRAFAKQIQQGNRERCHQHADAVSSLERRSSRNVRS